MKLPTRIASFPLKRFPTVLLPKVCLAAGSGAQGSSGIGQGPGVLPCAKEAPSHPGLRCWAWDTGLAQALLWEGPGISSCLHTQLSPCWPQGPHDTCSCTASLSGISEDQLHPPAMATRPPPSLLGQAHKLACSAVSECILRNLYILWMPHTGQEEVGSNLSPIPQKPTGHHFHSTVGAPRLRGCLRERIPFVLQAESRAQSAVIFLSL